MAKKMTMAQYEKSSADKKADKKELAAINKKKAPKKASTSSKKGY
jgi:hypothetical protein